MIMMMLVMHDENEDEAAAWEVFVGDESNEEVA